jgi:hypothetical protein
MSGLRVRESETGVRAMEMSRLKARVLKLRNKLPILTVAAAIAVLGARAFAITWKYSVNLFFWDQWDYLTPFFNGHWSAGELFLWQHGPHREGIGLLADKFLYPLTGWNTRTDCMIIVCCIFLAMLLAVALKCKLYGPIAYSDIVIPMVFLMPAQFEAVIATPNPAYSGFPLLLIVLYCLTLLQRNQGLKYILLLALNFLLIYTGFGLLMGVITIGLFGYWSVRPSRPGDAAMALAGFAIAAASAGVFFIHYTFSPAVPCFEISSRYLLSYPLFIALLFSAFVIPTLTYVGLLITVGLAIALVVSGLLVFHMLHLAKNDSTPGGHVIGSVLLAYSLLFASTSAVGRVCAGLPATPYRYLTLLIPAFLAIYFYLLSRGGWKGRGVALILFGALLIPSTVTIPWESIRRVHDGKSRWSDCYRRTGNIYYCDQASGFRVYPEPEGTNLQQKLDYLRRNRLSLFSAMERR